MSQQQPNNFVLNSDVTNIAPQAPMGAIPEGWYSVVAANATKKPNAKGTGNITNFEYRVIEGDFANRTIYDRMNLEHENQQTVEIAWRTLSALQHAIGKLRAQYVAELYNIPFKVRLSLRPAGIGADGKSYNASNEVAEYAPYAQATPPSPTLADAARMAAAAPVVQGNPPNFAGGGFSQPQAPAAGSAFAPPPNFGAPTAAAPQPPAQSSFTPPPNFGQPQAPGSFGAPQQGGFAPPPPAAPAPPVPPPPVAAGPQMTPKANGASYEQFRQAGYTDQMMVEQGYMFPPQAPAAPPAGFAPPPPSVPAAAAPPAGQWQAPPVPPQAGGYGAPTPASAPPVPGAAPNWGRPPQ